MRELERGEIVIAPDPYNGGGRRPFVIVNDSDYPFYPHGYLGLPVTTKDRPHTWEIHEYNVEWENDGLHVTPSYVNPWSPSQVNEPGKSLMKMDTSFMDNIARLASKSLGVEVE